MAFILPLPSSAVVKPISGPEYLESLPNPKPEGENSVLSLPMYHTLDDPAVSISLYSEYAASVG